MQTCKYTVQYLLTHTLALWLCEYSLTSKTTKWEPQELLHWWSLLHHQQGTSSPRSYYVRQDKVVDEEEWVTSTYSCFMTSAFSFSGCLSSWIITHTHALTHSWHNLILTLPPDKDFCLSSRHFWSLANRHNTKPAVPPETKQLGGVVSGWGH